MGLPVIASNVPGCNNIIKDCVNGLLCKPRDFEDLYSKMEVIYKLGRTKRHIMGETGRETVRKHFSVETVIKKYFEKIKNPSGSYRYF